MALPPTVPIIPLVPMSEPSDSHPPSAKRRTDRRIKLGFLAVALVAAGVVFYLQLRPPKGIWSQGLPQGLQKARAENRRLLVLFTSSPPGETARRMEQTTLRKAHNRKAIRDGKFVCVRVTLDTALRSETARRYRIRKLPTMLILSPEGGELNRREGMIGEVPFRQGFLDCADVFRADPNQPPS